MKRFLTPIAVLLLIIPLISLIAGTRPVGAQDATPIVNTDISGELNVAMVANPQMVAIEKLAPEFEKQYPNIKLNLLVLPENEVRDRIRTDVSTQAGQFDVVTIGMYEAANYAQNGWVLDVGTPLQADPTYDYDDIFPAMKSALSYEDKLYAAPFYGESSMVMYRKDLMEKAGLTMPDAPTWEFIGEAARAMTDRANDINGICLRGKAG